MRPTTSPAAVVVNWAADPISSPSAAAVGVRRAMPPIRPWLRWPAYWHFGLLPGLRALDEAGYCGDPAAAPALDRLRRLRGADGRWRPDGRWWARPGRTGSNVEIVDWGQDGESAVLTLHALQLLGTDA